MIGELLAVACRDPAVLARLGGPIGDTARTAAHELAALPLADRSAMRARVIAAATAPIPVGVRGAHPSWLEAALVDLPRRARDALAGDLATASWIDQWLVRWACAEIPPLPAVDPLIVAASSLADLVRMTGAHLERWLVEVGLDQLIYGLISTAAGRSLVATNEPRLVRAAARIDQPPRVGALGNARSALARCRGVDPRSDIGLITIAARAIAPHVDPVAGQQLAVRLPRPLGITVRSQLNGHRDDPVTDAPTWTALAGLG